MIVTYCLFIGINFGAGILELLGGEKQKKVIAQTMGLHWELHHLWIVLAVLILYIGFPPIFIVIYQYLFIPIVTLVLVIIMRALAFYFRVQSLHEDERQNHLPNKIYRISSFVAAILIGVVVGSIISGNVNPFADSYFEAFIDPWLNIFSLSVALFVCCLFSFLASVYLIGESEDQLGKKLFIRWSKISAVLSVVSGSLVFVVAEFEKLYLIARFYYSPVAVGAVIVATLILPFLWKMLNRGDVWNSRIMAFAEMILVLTAWFQVQHPVVVALEYRENLTFSSSAAPEGTLLKLLISLAIGVIIILPSFVYLMRMFRRPGSANA